jgi:hypothetical protein
MSSSGSKIALNNHFKKVLKCTSNFPIAKSDCRDGVLNFQPSVNEEVAFVKAAVTVNTDVIEIRLSLFT